MAFFIVSDQGNVVIDIKGGNQKPKSGTSLDAFTQKKNDNGNQLWTFQPPASQYQAETQGFYFIQSNLKSPEDKHLVIAIKNASITPGASLQVDTIDPSTSGISADQLWCFMPGPSGFFFIASYLALLNGAGPLVVDIKGASQSIGAALQIDSLKSRQSPGGNDYQLWKFVDENGKTVIPPSPPSTAQDGWWPVPIDDNPGGIPYM